MITFDILTLFPNFFLSPLKESILGRAQKKGLIRVQIHNIREFTKDKHRVTDDYPFGGGGGMILKPEPVVEGVEKIKNSHLKSHSILLSPQGKVFNQQIAFRLAECEQIILVCGRYEGFDDRIRHFVDEEISLGDFILNGGESAALVIIETVSRLIPGVLGKVGATQEESFSSGLLEYPQYTRPRNFRGYLVPPVLISGDHEKIRQWRLKESIRTTLLRRPDLLDHKNFSSIEKKLLDEVKQEIKLNCLEEKRHESFGSS